MSTNPPEGKCSTAAGIFPAPLLYAEQMDPDREPSGESAT